MVIADAPFMQCLGPVALPQRPHRHRRGDVAQRFHRCGDLGCGKLVEATASLWFDDDQPARHQRARYALAVPADIPARRASSPAGKDPSRISASRIAARAGSPIKAAAAATFMVRIVARISSVSAPTFDVGRSPGWSWARQQYLPVLAAGGGWLGYCLAEPAGQYSPTRHPERCQFPSLWASAR